MDDNTARMAARLQKDPAALKALMQSQDGQTLMRLLTQGDQGAGLRRAVQSAVKGDTGDMTRMIGDLMRSPEGAAVVDRINKTVQK